MVAKNGQEFNVFYTVILDTTKEIGSGVCNQIEKLVIDRDDLEANAEDELARLADWMLCKWEGVNVREARFYTDVYFPGSFCEYHYGDDHKRMADLEDPVFFYMDVCRLLGINCPDVIFTIHRKGHQTWRALEEDRDNPVSAAEADAMVKAFIENRNRKEGSQE